MSPSCSECEDDAAVVARRRAPGAVAASEKPSGPWIARNQSSSSSGSRKSECRGSADAPAGAEQSRQATWRSRGRHAGAGRPCVSATAPSRASARLPGAMPAGSRGDLGHARDRRVAGASRWSCVRAPRKTTSRMRAVTRFSAAPRAVERASPRAARPRPPALPGGKLPGARSGPSAVSTVTSPPSAPRRCRRAGSTGRRNPARRASAGRVDRASPGRPSCSIAAAIHHRDAVGHRQRLVLVVRDEDGGDAELAQQALELDLHRLAQLAVERGEGLVEQQQLGAHDQGAGDGDALLLAARERARRAGPRCSAICTSASASRTRGARFGVRPTPLGLQAEGDVLGDRQMREQRVVLEDDADVAPVRRQARDLRARHGDAAGIRRAAARRRSAAGWSCRSRKGRAARRTRPAPPRCERSSSTVAAPKRFETPVTARWPADAAIACRRGSRSPGAISRSKRSIQRLRLSAKYSQSSTTRSRQVQPGGGDGLGIGRLASRRCSAISAWVSGSSSSLMNLIPSSWFGPALHQGDAGRHGDHALLRIGQVHRRAAGLAEQRGAAIGGEVQVHLAAFVQLLGLRRVGGDLQDVRLQLAQLRETLVGQLQAFGHAACRSRGWSRPGAARPPG